MTSRELADSMAVRCGLPKADARRILAELTSEIRRHLLLGEDVSLVGLGRVQLQSVKTVRRVSNLPGMKGKVQLTKAKKKIRFRQSTKAVDRLTREGLLSAIVTTVGDEDSKTVQIRRARMAKKKGKHVTVDVPREVESVTINVVDKKPKKKGESSSKQRLLG